MYIVSIGQNAVHVSQYYLFRQMYDVLLHYSTCWTKFVIPLYATGSFIQQPILSFISLNIRTYVLTFESQL